MLVFATPKRLRLVLNSGAWVASVNAALGYGIEAGANPGPQLSRRLARLPRRQAEAGIVQSTRWAVSSADSPCRSGLPDANSLRHVGIMTGGSAFPRHI